MEVVMTLAGETGKDGFPTIKLSLVVRDHPDHPEEIALKYDGASEPLARLAREFVIPRLLEYGLGDAASLDLVNLGMKSCGLPEVAMPRHRKGVLVG